MAPHKVFVVIENAAVLMKRTKRQMGPGAPLLHGKNLTAQCDADDEKSSSPNVTPNAGRGSRIAQQILDVGFPSRTVRDVGGAANPPSLE